MRRYLSLLAVLLCVPAHGWAQTAPAQPPKSAAHAATLVIMTAGTKEQREALNPAVDALCGEFATGKSEYRQVVRLQPETDLSALQQELTPHDDRAQKGAILRQLDGGLKAQAFQDCRDGSVPDRLIGPIEVILFRVSFGRFERVNVSVSRYAVEEIVSQLGQSLNTHIDLFRDVDALGRCARQHFWHRGVMTETECRARIGFEASSAPPEPRNDASWTTDLTKKWWFWGALGVVVAGAVTGVAVAANSGGSTDVYPSCPAGYACLR